MLTLKRLRQYGLGSAIAAIIICSAGAAEIGADASLADFKLACRLTLSDEGSLFLIKEAPLTLYLVQHFEDMSDFVKNHWYEGRSRLTFTSNQLVVEGAGVGPCSESVLFSHNAGPGPFFSVREFGGERGFDIFNQSLSMGVGVLDLWPANATFAQGVAIRGPGDSSQRVFLTVEAKGDENTITIYDGYPKRSSGGTMTPGEVRGKLSYYAFCQAAPWHREWDLDGDGLDEIVVMHTSFRQHDFIVFSRTPEHFLGLAQFAKKVGALWRWPEEGANFYEKGKKLVIPLK